MAKSGNFAVSTAKKIVFTGSPVPPPAPASITATPGNAQMYITWDAVGSANSYTLYWTTGATIPAKTSNKIADILASSYTHTGLTNGTKYNYAVAASNANGESALSGVVSGVPSNVSYKSHYGNNPALYLTGQDFANWDPADSHYKLTLAGDYVWE